MFPFILEKKIFTDSSDCFPCGLEYWSNESKDRCVLNVVKFLSYSEIMGIVFCIYSFIGVLLTAMVYFLFIFITKHLLSEPTTPSTASCCSSCSYCVFFCSLTFIGRPTEWSFMFRHTKVWDHFCPLYLLCSRENNSCVNGLQGYTSR